MSARSPGSVSQPLATRRPWASTTASPSSFVNACCCGDGRRSSTCSEGRHRRVPSGVTTIGMPIGLGVIVFTILITGIYVRRANKDYDVLAEQIAKEALK